MLWRAEEPRPAGGTEDFARLRPDNDLLIRFLSPFQGLKRYQGNPEFVPLQLQFWLRLTEETTGKAMLTVFPHGMGLPELETIPRFVREPYRVTLCAPWSDQTRGM